MSRIKFITALATVALVLSAALALAADTPMSSQPAPAKTAPKAHHMSSGAKHMATPRIDLNSATAEDLAKVPGIDAATADKIIAARPFKTRSELVSKKIVTKAEYSKLASHVTVKSEPTAAKAAK